MNPIQKQLLELADTTPLGDLTYYSIAKKLSVNHPYRVKFALDQLEKTGHIMRNKNTGKITKIAKDQSFTGFLSIPYYGEVNCGQALTIADDTIKNFLKVSPSVVRHTNLAKIFALKAKGNSMNKAIIHGRSACEGDYILAEKVEKHQIRSGDYVISIIQGYANLKRIYIDYGNEQIVLFSESSEDYPPIIISTIDADEDSAYVPIARAVEIIKGGPAIYL